MRPDSLRLWSLTAACVLSACSSHPPPSQPDPGPPPTDAGTGTSSPVTPSSHNHLRTKNPEQLLAHFSAALSLLPAEVCNELGQYSCTSSVHTVALGGVDPYGIGIYEPLPATGATTPIIIDRMALMACGRRVSLDLAQPSRAVLFGGIALDGQGHMVDREGAPVRGAITALYQRALLRDPTPAEVGTLSGMATEIETLGGQTPGRDWMISACFTVLSSAESVFF